MNTPSSESSSNPYRAPATGEDIVGVSDEAASVGVQNALQQTRPWVLFIGIISLIVTGLMLFGSLGMAFYGTFATGAPGGGPPFILMGIMYFVMGLIYIPPSLFLLRYAKRIREFISAPSPANLESALVAQKSFWRFIGILPCPMRSDRK